MQIKTLFRRALPAVLSVLVLTSVLTGFIRTSPAAAAAVGSAAIATTPAGDGYWTASPQGIVNPAGNAAWLGDLRANKLNRPINGMASTPSGHGYWMVASDGGIFSFGDAGFYGSTGSVRLNQPIVGMASTPSGHGYWMVASDGGVFSFGDAGFYGSTGSVRLNRPINAMASTPSGRGYWMVASDGGIFSFGDAGFYGSTGSVHLNQPVVGMASTPSGHGYWMVASDGGVFSFGDAAFRGSTIGGATTFGITPDGHGGYSTLRTDGAVLHHGDSTTTSTPVVTNPPATVNNPPATTTTTTAPPVSNPVNPSSGNPFSQRSLWVDPNNPARSQASAWASSRPADAALMSRMGNYASAVWIGEWSGDVTNAVRNITDQAATSNTLPVFVAYNIPSRDCGSFSAGGAAKASDYQAWIRGFAAGINGRPAAVILEPDALAQMDCLDGAGQASRYGLLSDAVNVLSSSPNTAVYIDAGHSGWHSPADMANRLSRANVANARGFSVNVSNFDSTSVSTAYGDAISNILGGKKFVVDTSRNGNGSNGEWCNPMGRALGTAPSANTGDANADAYLWLKRPGESDGNCNGGPSAGSWWGEYANNLAHAAWG